MRHSRLLCVLAVLLMSLLGFAEFANAQCENSFYVTSFNIAPGTIVADGYQVALGTFTVNNSEARGVTQREAFGASCVTPSFFAGDTNGCQPVNGVAQMTFSGTTSETTPHTYNTQTLFVPPYISAMCPDPGKFSALTVLPRQLGPLSPPGPNTPSPVCPDGNCPGGSPQGSAPINFLNGNTWIEHQDYALPGLGGGLDITRTWNSSWPSLIAWPGGPTMDVSGMFGHSWRSTYEERLQTLTGGITKYWQANGNAWFFTYDSVNGTYGLTDPITARGTLTFDSGTTQYTITFKDGSKRIFNNAGRLVAIKDHNGNQTSISIDGSNRITQVSDAAGRTIYFDYLNGSFPNLATALRDSGGTLATYVYDTSGRLTQVTYADGSKFNYVYDASNLITSVTDANNVILESHTYDAQRRGLTGARANNVEKVSVTYLSNPPGVNVCNSFNSCHQYYSTQIGRQTYFGRATNSASCSTCGVRYAIVNLYDPATGNVGVSTPDGRASTYYTYDAQGNVTRTVQLSAGTLQTIRREWNYTYNSFGQVLTATDPLGKITTNTYDTNGNLLTTTTPSPDGGTTPGSTTTFTYNSLGQLLTITDPRNNVTTLTYTSAGLIETITNAQNKITKYEYDARGNRTAVTEDFSGLAIRTTFEYDSRNRLKKINHPTNPATNTQFAYDLRGRRTSVTDANSKVTTYAYDDADRLTSVTDAQTPSAGITSYAYDSESNLTSITDALGRVTTFTYFLNNGNLQKITFPPATPGGATLNEQFSYNNQGQVTWMQDRKSQVTTFGYNGFGDLARKSPAEGDYLYYYDAAGHLTKVDDTNATNGTGVYEFTYDGMGRMSQAKTTYKFMNNQVFTVNYGYDAASNRTSMADPQSSTTNYVYDALNRLQTLQSPQGNFGFTYDALNRRTQMTRPNGVNTNYSYDSLSRLLSILHQVGANTIDGATYTYDNVGNRLTKLNQLNSQTETYGYDNIYQLLSVLQGATTTESYTYDKVGNRLTDVSGATYTVNGRNQLTTVSGSPNTTFTYDNNGNTATKVDGTGTTTYTWNSQNQLKQVSLPGGATVTFKYDPFGRRVQKVSASGSINYLYDGVNVIEELDSAGAVIAKYAQGEGVDEPLAMLRTSSSYYAADGLGSVTSLSDNTGVIANSYTYDTFGKLSASTATLVNSFRYTAREFDNEIGLYYYRARSNDVKVGRFTSEDPLRFKAGINFYPYVKNNPANATDPYGLIVGPLPFPEGPCDNFQRDCSDKKRCDDARENCEAHLAECFLRKIADRFGRTFGSRRCLECYDHCINSGGRWPRRWAPRTVGRVRCDYWKYPKGEDPKLDE